MKTENFYKPTPRKLRKLGDGFLAIGTTITATAIAQGVNWLAYAALFCMIIGKFLTNFYSE